MNYAMRQILLSTMLVGLLAPFSWGQQSIPNSSFENWGFFTGEPEGWITTNAMEFMGMYDTTTVFEENTRVYHGSAALRAVTLDSAEVDTLGVTFSGAGAITGEVTSFDPLEFALGFGYSDVPVRLRGYYQYYPVEGDTGSLNVTLTRWDSVNQNRDIVATGSYFFTDSVTSYQSFTAELVYLLCPPPDTARITFTTSIESEHKIGTELLLDSLNFVTDAPNSNAPQTNPDYDSTVINTQVTLSVVDNDNDPDNDSLFLVDIVTPPVHGSAFISSATTISYTPDSGFVGKDSLQYRIRDTDLQPAGCEEEYHGV
jgi:hypothetical protein